MEAFILSAKATISWLTEILQVQLQLLLGTPVCLAKEFALVPFRCPTRAELLMFCGLGWGGGGVVTHQSTFVKVLAPVVKGGKRL